MSANISIIGHNVISQEIGNLLKMAKLRYNVHDKITRVGLFNYFNTIQQLVISAGNTDSDTHFYFVTLSSELVEDVLDKLNSTVTKNSYVIIKSTLIPGSMEKFSLKYNNIHLVYSPVLQKDTPFILFGFAENCNHAPVMSLIDQLLPNTIKILRTFTECEMFKCTLDTIIDTRVIFFTKIHQLCVNLNVDYTNLQELFALDPHIGITETIITDTPKSE